MHQQEIISLVSSSNGPLQPTAKIAYQDIKVGLPNVLLCIEMAIFAVMHIFAFPVKPYNIKAYSDPINEPGSGYSGETLKYKGGPLGLYALMDALNPWDIMKASARGFRWLFIGRKHREQDISYQDAAKMNASTEYAGPMYAGTGEAATELRPSNDERLGRKSGVAEDDRAGLLRHSATPAGMDQEISPPRPYANDEYASGDDTQHDLGTSHRLHPSESASNDVAPNPGTFAAPSKASDFGPGRPTRFEGEDPGNHPGIGPAGVHPALRDQQRGGGETWDHWAGATAASSEDEQSVRPPTYRTRDPR